MEYETLRQSINTGTASLSEGNVHVLSQDLNQNLNIEQLTVGDVYPEEVTSEKFCPEQVMSNMSNLNCRAPQDHGKFQCGIRNQSFKLKSKLLLHFNQDHSSDDQSHKCNDCGAIFRLEHDLDEHKEKKHVKKYQCDVCSSAFTTKYKLTCHLQKHTDEVFICDVCGKQLKTIIALQNHKRIHLNRKFECNLCGKCFSTSYRKKSHTCNVFSDVLSESSEKSQSENNTFYNCKICHKFVFNEANLKKHMTRHSTAEKANKFPCNMCVQNFKSKEGLEIHLHRCHGNMYDCNVCGEKFSDKSDYKVHENTHLSDGKFACYICDKRYTTKLGLRLHINKKHKQVQITSVSLPYECEFCGKKFASKNVRAEHMHAHTGLRPFICKLCNKSYSTKAGLSAHDKSSHNERAFECGMCGSKYINKSQLETHFRKKHQMIQLQHTPEVIQDKSNGPNDGNRESVCDEIIMNNESPIQYMNELINELTNDAFLPTHSDANFQNLVSKSEEQQNISVQEIISLQENNVGVKKDIKVENEANQMNIVKTETEIQYIIHETSASEIIEQNSPVICRSGNNVLNCTGMGANTLPLALEAINPTHNGTLKKESNQNPEDNVGNAVLVKLGAFKVNSEDLQKILNGTYKIFKVEKSDQ